MYISFVFQIKSQLMGRSATPGGKAETSTKVQLTNIILKETSLLIVLYIYICIYIYIYIIYTYIYTYNKFITS